MFIKNLRNSALISMVILLGSCDLIKIKDEKADTRITIARANDQYLYLEDIQEIVTPGLTSDDSIERVEKFIEDWAKKQLLISEARNIITFDDSEIERKVLDYRYSLMGHEFQQYYIRQNLDKDVSDEEIESYYNSNPDNFTLMQNIIRGKFIKIPKVAPRADRIKSLLLSNKEADFEELKSYCLSFASSYQLYDSVWMVFEDVVKNTPLADVPNKVQFLQNRKYVEENDTENLYFLKIEEYRISDSISPIEFVRDQIRNIILNKRMVILAKKLEDDVYNNAKENNEFEIYYR